MAVTKRTRFEVLRRDDYTCQYCGAKAPDVTLTIDHVMPQSLGGDDKPGNLLTACKDCNSGKSSITPDSPLVQGLSDRAAAYALGMQDKMTRFRADFESLDSYVHAFRKKWDSWTYANDTNIPLPGDYELALFKWMQIGVPIRALDLAIKKAMNKSGLRGEYGEFTYMAGVIHRMLDDREIDLTVTSETVAVYTEAEHRREKFALYRKGYQAGKEWARHKAMALDPLRNHIDGTVAVEHEESGVWEVVRIGEG